MNSRALAFPIRRWTHNIKVMVSACAVAPCESRFKMVLFVGLPFFFLFSDLCSQEMVRLISQNCTQTSQNIRLPFLTQWYPYPLSLF